MSFGPTVQFECPKCRQIFNLGDKCRCLASSAIGDSTKTFGDVDNGRDANRKIKNLEFELERAKIDRDEFKRCATELELLYETEKECLRAFKALLLQVKGITAEELLKLSQPDNKTDESGLRFSLLEVDD